MGGAIFDMQGEVFIENSTLAGNSVFGGTTPGDLGNGQALGGAVFNLSGFFIVIGSTFASNTAADDGTSVYNLVYDSVRSALREGGVQLDDHR